MKENDVDINDIAYHVVQKIDGKIETSVWPAKFLALKIDTFMKNNGDILTITTHRHGDKYAKQNEAHLSISDKFEEIIQKADIN